MPPCIRIREARGGDAHALSALISQLGYELDEKNTAARLEHYNNDRSAVFVAQRDSELIGFLSFHAIPLFHENADLGRITAMAIREDCRRQGVGRLLVQAAEEHAVSLHCSRLEVTSGDHREHDAHLFYLAQGYCMDCRRFLKHLPSPGSL
ncbi:MAG TPA: GNAT family N-acetyltransferase [Chthoniobacterales bacterium]